METPSRRFGSGWKHLRSVSGRPLGGPLATSTRGPVRKLWFFPASAGVGTISCLRMVSRVLFGWYLDPLLVVRRCFFTLFGVGFFEFFERASVVVALCSSHTHLRHFASQLTVSTTSSVSRMCRSAIPLTWVTCHANMSVCVVMQLPGVSSHCETPEVNRCKTP